MKRAVTGDLGEDRRRVVGPAARAAPADHTEQHRRGRRARVERAAAVAVAARAQRLVAVDVDGAEHPSGVEALAAVAPAVLPHRRALLVAHRPQRRLAQAARGEDLLLAVPRSRGELPAAAQDPGLAARGAAAERDRCHRGDRPVELDEGHVVEDVVRAVGVAPARMHRVARAAPDLGADHHAGEVRERDVRHAVAGGEDPVGGDQHAPAAVDLGEPRNRFGCDRLTADHRARRRGGGESDQHGEQTGSCDGHGCSPL